MQKEPINFECKIHACTANGYCVVIEGLPGQAHHLTNWQDVEYLFDTLKKLEKVK